jgi:hypothetical protein
MSSRLEKLRTERGELANVARSLIAKPNKNPEETERAVALTAKVEKLNREIGAEERLLAEVEAQRAALQHRAVLLNR